MENADDRRTLARLYADGQKREEIAKVFNVHPDTITTWVQRADVQAMISKYTEERANRILRKTDKSIEGRLEHVDKMDIETLLKVRKEFVPDRSETTIKVDQAGAVEDLVEKLAKDPDLAAALLAGATQDSADESDTD
jgi:transposase